MTDLEYDVIDNLYFVTSYGSLKEELSFDDRVLMQLLWRLMEKRWVKCLRDPESEIWPDHHEFELNFSDYHYLATKEGLFLHNER